MAIAAPCVMGLRGGRSVVSVPDGGGEVGGGGGFGWDIFIGFLMTASSFLYFAKWVN